MATQDPTSKNRAWLYNTVIPDNSPLGKSRDEAIAREQQQLAVDEANNLVEVRQSPVLPSEVQAFSSPHVLPTTATAPTAFVNPAAVPSPQAAATSPMMSISSGGDPVATYNQGASIEANAIAKMGQQEAGAYKNVEEQLQGVNQQIQDIQTQEQKAFEDFQKEDEDTQNKIKNFELKPKNFFAGKNTWQKILGGIGMFLGSITPEGARSVQNIIDKEIERDLEIQKNELALLKDNRSEAANRYKLKLDLLGSDRLAKMSMKKDALEMAKLQLDQIAASSKGELARAAALKGRAVIEQGQAQLKAEIDKGYMQHMQSMKKGAIPGYQGYNENPSMVKEASDRVAAGKAAYTLIGELESLLKKGASMPLSSRKKLADQATDALAAEIAKSQAGGKYSDFEYEKARGMIPDITSWMQSGKVDKELLTGLRKKVSANVDSYLSTAGYSRILPANSGKIQ